jgi:hypothetical protein
VLGLDGGAVVDLLPSFAASPSRERRFVDEDGEQVTALTVELEEHCLLRDP